MMYLETEGHEIIKRGKRYFVKDFEKSEEEFTKRNDFDGLGSLAVEKGNYEQAIQYFEKANNKNALGDLYYRLQSYDDAFKIFDESNFYSKAASSLKEGNKPDEAITYIQNKLQVKPDQPELYEILGQVYSEKGSFEDADKSFQKLGESDLYKAKSLYLRAMLNIKFQKFSEAEELITRLKVDFKDSSFSEKGSQFTEFMDSINSGTSTVVKN